VFSLSPIKILVVVAVIMLLMGPDKLPEVAHRIGAAWRAVKKLQERVEAEVRDVIPDLPSTGDIARIARSPVHLLNQLADRVDAKEGGDAAGTSATSDASTPLLSPRPVSSAPPPVEPGGSPPDPSLN